MSADFMIVLRWWITILLVGWVAWPLVRRVFIDWEDQGYIFAKVAGMMGISWGVMVLGSLKLGGFSIGSMLLVATLIMGLGMIFGRIKRTPNLKVVVFAEVMFLAALLLWSWVKGHGPDINGLEKFMDYGFAKSIMRSVDFPPADMWFAGESINYYYFGHLMMAVITKLSGVGMEYGFNLMLVSIFAFCWSGSFSIGRELLKRVGRGWRVFGAILIAFLVTLSGNLQTIYAFTKGYAGSEDNPPPFWKIMNNPWDEKEFKLGWGNYWYPNATRFIPYTIHEFPGYSFVVSDVHGHVLSIPLVILAIALLVNMFGRERERIEAWEFGLYGFVSGLMFMTNALDGPIYMGLLGFLALREEMGGAKKIEWQKLIGKMLVKLALPAVIFGVTVLPFVIGFKPFVSGVAVNCPPKSLAYDPQSGGEGYRKIGPIVFEGVEKCQKSPLWMMLILWGFFLYCGLDLIKNRPEKERGMFGIWAMYSILLIMFAEFFYFKDIYPQHFRSNTMFKLGYQAFILMSIVAGYVITVAIKEKKKWFLLGVAPLLILVSIYPYFSVRSYFGNLKTYYGLYGLSWLDRQYPDDAAAIAWFNETIAENEQPVILEANGDSYTDYERMSVFTGLPTVAGWTVHEWLWRGSYEPIARRADEVKWVYETPTQETSKEVLRKYGVEYIVVGNMERQKYQGLDEAGIASLGEVAFKQGMITVYKLRR